MQEIEKYSNLLFNAKEEEIKKVINGLKEENEKLQLENEQLKKELEREQVLHKNLYNEWKELKEGPTVKKNGSIRIKRFVRKKSSSYGLFSIVILLSLLIVYWAFSNGSGRNTFSSPAGLSDTTAIDTVSKNKAQPLEQKSSIAKIVNKK